MNIDTIADEFERSARLGVYYPPAMFNQLEMTQALQVQHALLRRKVNRGETHTGWKVGLTAKAIQDQFNVHEPVCGYLLKSGMIRSGNQLKGSELIGPGIENEICFRMKKDLIGPNVSANMARDAVGKLYPAMELVENRGDFSAQIAVSLADNVQQTGYVLGDPLTLTDSLDIATINAQVFLNAELVGEGNATAVLGSPFNSLAWLANKLAELGLHVRAGDYVMAGSLTKQFALQSGDTIRTEFSGGLGEVLFGLS
jgi:2-keto-4-pentenoate hydratase